MGREKPRKPDWADRIASATAHLRGKNSWEYEHPINAWESMPWFVRWPLAIVLAGFLGGALLIGLALMWRHW